MKKISIVIPCFNEVENVCPISEAVIGMMKKDLQDYDYEILFIDNCSTDGTRDKLRGLCKENKKIKAIFNAANFGQFNSPFYGMCQSDGDCTVLLCADFQDPVDMIPKFVAEWERGHRIVSGVKTSSRENGFIYFLRTVYYRIIRSMSQTEFIEHFTGFGLYDRSFILLLRELHDSSPFLRGIVAEYGHSFNRIEIPYRQEKRRAGKTKNNFYSLYDAAMLSITSYTKVGLRLATFVGFISSGLSLVVALIYLIMKLIWWNRFSAGSAPIVLGIYVIGSLQLFFIGLLGEYILNINSRVINRPIVVEEERLNFGEGEEKKQIQERGKKEDETLG